MAGAKGAVQRAQHHVERLDIAHLLAPAGRGHDIGAARHRLGTAGNRVIRVAQHHVLNGRDNRLRTGTTQTVHVHRRSGFRDTGLHRGNAAQVHVAWFGVDHVAKDDMADLPAFDARTFKRGFGHDGGQINRGHAGQGASEGPDCGAGTVQNNDISHSFTPFQNPRGEYARRSFVIPAQSGHC